MSVKTCNFNCTCTHSDCTYYHNISSYEDRIEFKEEIYDKIYNKSKHNETDPDGCRKVVCKFGLLCNKEDCGFKHHCNFSGRAEMCKLWWKESRKRECAKLVDKIKSKLDEDELEQLKKLLGVSSASKE